MTSRNFASKRLHTMAAVGWRLTSQPRRKLLAPDPLLRSLLVVMWLTLVSLTAVADTPARNNQELARLFSEDQADRIASSIDWSVVSKLDADRRRMVLDAFRKGEVRTAQDYYHAAFIFHHGPSGEDSRMAYSLASLSLSLDPENKKSRWLVAASWDRIMVKHNRAQWYGTQITRRAADGAWATHETDWDATSDDEKAHFGVTRPGAEPWLPRQQDSREPIVVPRVPR